MIVAIDTSSAISVVVTDDAAGEALAHRSVFAPRGHAEQLTDLVRQAMDEAGVPRSDVTGIVVGTGPAPFTGLRVGLVTARMLSFAWDVPVWGVCSLDALGAAERDAVVVGDARRREVYWARYRDGVRTEGPAVSAPADVVVGEDERVVGRGAAAYADAFPGAIEADPDPLWLAREALRRRAEGEELHTEPLYLRRPDVHGV
jgi:tRNA threonylcarbamoyladenosine biosynthesis protein TsaB